MRYLIALSLLLMSARMAAQVPRTLSENETLFQRNNLDLLAEQYNISANRAAQLQAAIWELPYAAAEINLVNPQDRRLLDAGGNGQKAFSVQQLIYLGGKKKREVDFAKSNVAIAELQYQALLMNLRFRLRRTFYALYFNQLKAGSIQGQLGQLDTLIQAYADQAQKGNVPLKDVVRLQSLSFSLRGELNEIQQNIFAGQEDLKTLTGDNDPATAVLNEPAALEKIDRGIAFGIAQLQALAEARNPEYLTTQKLIENSVLMLRWQQSLNVPDLTAGASYDQRGGAFNNQVNLTLGVPIPFWKRNRGSVQQAAAGIDRNKASAGAKLLAIRARVAAVYQQFVYQKAQYSRAVLEFQNFRPVYLGVLQNFRRQNISIIEFTDFMESYNRSVQYLNELKMEILTSGEELNYLTNDNVF